MLVKFLDGSGLIFKTIPKYEPEEVAGYVANGFIEISEEDYEKYASMQYVYDFDTGKPKPFESLPLDLEETKKSKIAELKKERTRREKEPVEYNGKLFDYDDDSRDRLRLAQKRIQAKTLDSQTWTCADNTFAELTAADIDAIDVAAGDRSTALHTQYNKLKAMINDMEDAEAVQAITFDTDTGEAEVL